MDSTELALHYLSLGWAVIPAHVPVRGGRCSCANPECSWPGKHPRIPWREYTKRLPTEGEVETWFGDTYYESNVGMVTGQVSQMVVVDVDGDPNEFTKLDLPYTLTSATGGGGHHYFYHCESIVRGRGGMVEGIDLKAEGGFVVLPPSLHKSGKRYRWYNRMTPTELDPTALPISIRSEATNGYHKWYHELIKGVDRGARSNSAAQLTGRYAQIGLAIEETRLLMSGWNELNTPPMTQSELAGTIRSVYQKHSDTNGQPIESLQDILHWFRGRS